MSIRLWSAGLLAAGLMVFPACEKSKQANWTQNTEMSTKTGELSPETVDKSPDLSTGAVMKVRQAALAGQWYSKDPEALRLSIEKYLAEAPEKLSKETDIRALVVPHAGHYWSGPTAAVGYRALAGRSVNRIFILCPNHRMPVRGAVSVSVDAFETPLGQIKVDRSVIETWQNSEIIRVDDAPHRQEHAIEIQLPFIQTVFQNNAPMIVPIIVGEISQEHAKKLADALKSVMREDDLLVISTDFMHYGENYGYVPFGAPVLPQIREYDARTIAAIGALNGPEFEQYAQRMPHSACGLNALRVLSHVFDGQGMKGVELAYDTSGRRSGDDEMSVSYAAMAIVSQKTKVKEDGESSSDGGLGQTEEKKQEQEAHMDAKTTANETPVPKTAQVTAHQIVKQALTAAVEAQKTTAFPKDLQLGNDADVFRQSFGVFVTLEDKRGHLRGCIGNILPVATLDESLWGRAQDAALNDPRFDPVTLEELSTLSIEISVLTPPQPIDHPNQIVIGKHGVILKKGYRSAVFLPQVAPEQGWNVEQMLRALSMKAGLPPEGWHGATFSVFEAQVF